MNNTTRINDSSVSSEGSYSTTVAVDPVLKTNVITLLYTDANQPARTIEAAVAPDLGSNLFRYRVGEYDLIYTETELLQQKTFTGNFVLWPFPNRVRDQRYTFHGKSYSLKAFARVPSDPILIHGLVFDRPWQYEQPITTTDTASVTTFIEITPDSPEYAAYPFASRLSLTYTLTSQGLTVAYRVENTGEQELPYGFALHPYFSLPSDTEETYVTIPADLVMEADDTLLPTGRTFDVDTVMYAMYDLRTPRRVSSLRLDHVYTHLHADKPTILDYRTRKLQLHITATPDFTHMVIYHPPTSVPYVCLENQTCSTDAINLQKEHPELAHLLTVQPGESRTGAIHYTLYFA